MLVYQRVCKVVGGWAYPSEKYESVSLDDDIPIYEMENKIHVPNHQPGMFKTLN